MNTEYLIKNGRKVIINIKAIKLVGKYAKKHHNNDKKFKENIFFYLLNRMNIKIKGLSVKNVLALEIKIMDIIGDIIDKEKYNLPDFEIIDLDNISRRDI